MRLILLDNSGYQKKTEKRRSGTQSRQAALNDDMRDVVCKYILLKKSSSFPNSQIPLNTTAGEKLKITP